MFLLRIQHGYGQFNLGDFQSYSILYESDNYCLKVIVTQLKETSDVKVKITSFKLFCKLMVDLEDSIHSVMSLYIPSAELPVLYVACPLCDNATNPHILLGHARKISLKIPPLYCAEKDEPKPLPPLSYLPFGDTLTYEEYSKLIALLLCIFATHNHILL